MDITTPRPSDTQQTLVEADVNILRARIGQSSTKQVDLRDPKLVGKTVSVTTSIGSIYDILVEQTVSKFDNYWAKVVVRCRHKADDEQFDLTDIVSSSGYRMVTVGRGWVTRDHRTNPITAILIQ